MLKGEPLNLRCNTCKGRWLSHPGHIIYCPIGCYSLCRTEVILAEPTRDPLLVEREKTHGDFEGNARLHEKLMLAIMSELNSTMNSAQRLALSMMMLKVSRAAANPFEPEHWKDMAGYAKLGEEQCYSK